MNYTEVEARVREATNDDAWGPHGAIMHEIAQYTFTYEHFPEVMSMLWKRMLHENKKNWRRVYKVIQPMGDIFVVNLIAVRDVKFVFFPKFEFRLQNSNFIRTSFRPMDE